MPKLIDYPRASLKSALELADAVSSLGGSCTVDMAAAKLEKKVSGAFQAQISAATKYQLLENKSQKLSVSPLYKEIKLAYDEIERTEKSRQAFMSVPVFRDVWNRFAGQELPASHFEKLLIREFGIPEDWGSRIASYFIDGARATGVMDENNRLLSPDGAEVRGGFSAAGPTVDAHATAVEPSSSNETPSQFPKDRELDHSQGGKHYVVNVKGPGMNSTIQIHEAEDLLIVNAMLKKVERALQSATPQEE